MERPSRNDRQAKEAVFASHPIGFGHRLSPDRHELLAAVAKYIRRFPNNRALRAAENIVSPRYGRSDLLFVAPTGGHVVCVKLDDGKECERFLISSISYYFWLKELIHAARFFFGKMPRLDMFFFLGHISEDVSFMLEKLRDNLRVHLIQYRFMRSENEKERVLCLEQLLPGNAHSENVPMNRS
jgi:hypothetical protein